MPVQFETIKRGSVWERKDLARLWGYQSFHAISRGVVTPAGMNYIILFVTETKQTCFPQYADRLTGKTLHWEGEDGHGNDVRITRAKSTGDEIHVFHRELHHEPFTYIGEVKLQSFKLLKDKPSEFEFQIV